MRERNVLIVVALLGTMLAGCRIGPPPPMADVGATIIGASADIQADQRTVEELLVTFHRADEALHQQDLDSLMNIYSKHYNYHGIDKAELRNIWQDLFKQYRNFSNTHVFPKIVVDEKKTPFPSCAFIPCLSHESPSQFFYTFYRTKPPPGQ